MDQLGLGHPAEDSSCASHSDEEDAEDDDHVPAEDGSCATHSDEEHTKAEDGE